MGNSPGARYADGAAHLRDELWRVWLCAAYHIHRRWERGIIPRGGPGDGIGGLWSAASIASLIANAEELHADVPAVAEGEERTSEALATAFRAQSARIEARIAGTLAAGAPLLPIVDVARAFGLTPLQRVTLTLALMPELEPDLLVAYRYLAQDIACRGLDGRLLATMVYDTPDSRPHLSLDLSPLSPLIHYRLLEVDEGLGGMDPAMYRRIQPAPRLVQIAVDGAHDLDPQLRDAATLAPRAEAGLFPEEVAARVRESLGKPGVMLVLQGPRGAGKRLIVENAAAARGERVLLLHASHLGSLSREQLAPVLRGLLREALLLRAVPMVPNLEEAIGPTQDERSADELPEFVVRLATAHPGPIAVSCAGIRLPRIDVRPVVQLALDNPSLTDRATLWRRSVPSLPEAGAATLAERFAVPGGLIRMAAEATPGDSSVEALDHAMRAQLHDRLSRLGRRLDTHFTFEDLVVEQNILDTLVEIASAMVHRRRVREQWGFRGPPGISVLFSGSPGVGKTMGATVLARELGLAIYEIDLASTVSKWIGETEKNLDEILTAAEPGHAILLFNEADALFGKRTTDVRNATDRYANLETNFLLQRLEKFSGLAILTTNLTSAIDAAFRRRFSYDVQFSFPTVEMRAELWRRAVPAQAEVGEIDYNTLAEEFELSGGFIKLAVERAAFAAAEAGEPLSTDLIIPTVQRMYLERGKLAPIGRLE